MKVETEFLSIDAPRGQTSGPVSVHVEVSPNLLELFVAASNDHGAYEHLGRSVVAVATKASLADPSNQQKDDADTIEAFDASRGPVDAKQPMNEAEEQAYWEGMKAGRAELQPFCQTDAPEQEQMNTAGAPTVFAGPHKYRISILGQMAVSETANKIVERDFNPHQREDVNEIKELAAILVTRCEYLRNKHNWYGVGADRAKRAIEKFEEGAMLAVKAIFA